jgi:hypothetical protein
MSSKIGKFLVNFLLIPVILSLILYALLKPILWGILTFLGLCFVSIVSIFIFKRLFNKKPQQGE